MINKRCFYIICLSLFSFHWVNGQNYRSTYKIVSIDKFKRKVEIPSRVITRRYIPIPFDLKTPKKFFFKSRNIDTLLCSGVEIIFENDFNDLSSNRNIVIGSDIYSFLKACILVNTQKYDEAINILNNGFTEPSLDFLGKLFLADCVYDRTSSRKNAIKKSFEYYQEAYDATEDSLRKNLVKARLNYIRYNAK